MSPFQPLDSLVNPAAGCQVWRAAGDNGGIPIAQVDGRRRNLRRLVWERAGRPLDRALRLTTICGNSRCLAVDHLAPFPPPAEPKPERRPRVHSLRPLLAARLPATEPATMSEARLNRAERHPRRPPLAAIGAEAGLSRQGVNFVANVAFAQLSNGG